MSLRRQSDTRPPLIQDAEPQPLWDPWGGWPFRRSLGLFESMWRDIDALTQNLHLGEEQRMEMVRNGARIVERSVHFESHTDREGKTHTTGEAKQVEIQGSEVEDAAIKRESGELDLGEVAARYTYRLDAPDVEVLANNKRNNHDTGKRSAG